MIEWIKANQETIIGILTSSTFISIVLNVIALIKTILATKNNKLSFDNLQKVVKKYNDDYVKSIDERNKVFANELEILKCELSTIKNKFNAMLDVFSLVYSTIRDERMRATVSTLLSAAKHDEVESQKKLLEEIEELKAQVTENVEQSNTAAAGVIAKADSIIKAHEKSTRY